MVQQSATLPQHVAIFGATSRIAEEVARLYAGRGASLMLVARDAEALRRNADDLVVRGAANVQTLTADFRRVEDLPNVVDDAWSSIRGLDVALIAFGACRIKSEQKRMPQP